jgi:replicative DNA helicase
MSNTTQTQQPSNSPKKLSDMNLDYYKTPTEILDSLSRDVDQRTKTPRLPTGLPSLDRIIFGVHKKELCVIAGRPSHGKSALSLSICWNLAKNGKKVIFMPLEMSRENTYERIICSEYNISNIRLRQGEDDAREKFYLALADFHERFGEAQFEVIERVGKSIRTIEETIGHFNPDVICVDHVQKISTKGYSSKYEALSEFMNQIQEVAIKHNIAVIATSQLGRSEEFAKGAGEIEENADCLISINWKVRKDPQYSDNKEYDIVVSKQRHGPCDYCVVNFDGSTYMIL